MGRYNKKPLTRGGVVFRMVWLAIIVVILIVWGVGLVVVNKMLVEYESVQPVYEAERVFEEYFKNADNETILSYGEYKCSPYEDKNNAITYLNELTEGKELTFSSSLTTGVDTKAYIVAAGDVQIATFTLVKSEEKSEMLGLEGWKLGKLSTTLVASKGVNVYAPKNSVVKVNGTPLTDEHISGDAVVLKDEAYFPEDDDSFRVMVNYFIDGFFVSPSVRVESTDKESVEFDLVYEEKNSAYSAEYDYLLHLAAKHNAQVLENEYYRDRAEERRRLEEEEKRRQEEEERAKEEALRQQISDEIEAEYGEFVEKALKIYGKYFYVSNNDRVDLVYDYIVKYYKYGTTTYWGMINYYNHAAYFPSEFEYRDLDMTDFAWTDESKTSFTCRFRMNLVAKGVTTTGEASETVEPFDHLITVDVSGKSPLIIDQSLYVPPQR